MKKDFVGVHTALVTPFHSDKSIDYKSLESLINEQIEHVDGIVVLGTTGESPAISESEAKQIIKLAVKIGKNKVKIIVGTGSNNTQIAKHKSKLAEDLGADAILSMNPYYNKPTQEGMYQHFIEIADSINIPVILYNVKGRTSVNLETDTLIKLSKHKNIAGVKEASGDLVQIMDVIANIDSDFAVISGDDSLTYPIMCLGGVGVVSVVSNIFPSEMKSIVENCSSNIFDTAKQTHYKLYHLMNALLSISSNPIPVKAILAYLGKVQEELRLPLCSLDSDKKYALIKIYENCLND